MQFMMPYENSQESSIAMCFIEIKASQAEKLQKLLSRQQKEQGFCNRVQLITIPEGTVLMVENTQDSASSGISTTRKTSNFFKILRKALIKKFASF